MNRTTLNELVFPELYLTLFHNLAIDLKNVFIFFEEIESKTYLRVYLYLFIFCYVSKLAIFINL